MSAPEEQNDVVVFDSETWQSKTLDYEVTHKNPTANIAKTHKVSGFDLKAYLDAVEKPEELEIDTEFNEVLNKTIVFLPFTFEEMQQNNIRDQYHALKDKYPHINMHFPYEFMTRSYLHELARHYKVVDENSRLAEEGKLVQVKPVEQKRVPKVMKFPTDKVIEKGVSTVSNEAKVESALEKIVENQDADKLYPAETGIDEEGVGTDTEPEGEFKVKDQVPPGAGVPPAAPTTEKKKKNNIK